MTTNDKHPAIIVRSEQPFNAEPPLELLRENECTPISCFFVRNHGPIPHIDPIHYRLAVGGLVHRALSLSLNDLRTHFTSIDLPATLQCAGNRRTEMMAVQPTPGELPWAEGAISTGVWRGVPLRDVLDFAGIDASASHVALTGSDQVERLGSTFGFGGSIPLDKALSAEVMLAYDLNGEPLPPVHGFPLRLVAPGYIGARSVKWLSRITLQPLPSNNYFQAHAYKLFPPQVHAGTVDWTQGIMLDEVGINAVICQPESGSVVAPGRIEVKGYAIGVAGMPITQVELSSDGGATWMQAELVGSSQRWTWRFWQAEIELAAGRHQLVVRAADEAGTRQPEDITTIWNFKGYMNNAWYRIEVEVCNTD